MKEQEQEHLAQYSKLVGKKIEYSITRDKNSTGIVQDKIDKKDKAEDNFTVTGYLVEDDASGLIVNISYWRVLSIVKVEKKIKEDKMPPGHIPGGFIRE